MKKTVYLFVRLFFFAVNIGIVRKVVEHALHAHCAVAEKVFNGFFRRNLEIPLANIVRRRAGSAIDLREFRIKARKHIRQNVAAVGIVPPHFL